MKIRQAKKLILKPDNYRRFKRTTINVAWRRCYRWFGGANGLAYYIARRLA